MTIKIPFAYLTALLVLSIASPPNTGMAASNQPQSTILKIWQPPLPPEHLSRLRIRPYYPQQHQQMAVRWPGSLIFQGDAEWLVSIKGNQIFHRPNNQAEFTALNLPLNRPHTITYNPGDQNYYITDTDNNHLLYGSNPFNSASMETITQIGGTRIIRPHDLLVDTDENLTYLLSSNPVKIFRFKTINHNEEVLDLSTLFTYARAISLIEGKIYVTGSASGRIARIDNFREKRVTIFQSGGKKMYARMGTWQTTGLVINDLAKYKGFWYVSSYFTESACTQTPCDYNQNKLIRFITWDKFTQGTWQDISSLLPRKLVPYFFTIHNQQLYLGLFNHSVPNQDNFLYRISN